MADSRFFKLAGPFTLAELASITGAEISAPASATRIVVDVATLETADETKISFLDNKKYTEQFKATRAGACFVRPELAALAPSGTICLVSKNPYKAYALAAQAFYPEVPATVTEISPRASVDPTAIIGEGVVIAAGVVVGPRAEIGAGVRIHPNAVIGAGVVIGAGSEIGANVSVSHAILGRHVRIHPGTVIGSPGFGFAIDPAGFVTVPQLGRVIIEDDVEIGANCAIDRGAGPDTVIGRGTRLDNLVQVAHNVKIGPQCVIAAHVGISGSSELGPFVMMGGQSGISGHLKIGAGARIAGQAGVMRDIPPKTEVMGTPAVPMKQFMRQVASLARLIRTKKGDQNDD